MGTIVSDGVFCICGMREDDRDGFSVVVEGNAEVVLVVWFLALLDLSGFCGVFCIKGNREWEKREWESFFAECEVLRNFLYESCCVGIRIESRRENRNENFSQ